MKSEHSHFDSIPDTRLLMRSEVNTSFIPCEREREGERQGWEGRWESAGKGRGRERERERYYSAHQWNGTILGGTEEK